MSPSKKSPESKKTAKSKKVKKVKSKVPEVPKVQVPDWNPRDPARLCFKRKYEYYPGLQGVNHHGYEFTCRNCDAMHRSVLPRGDITRIEKHLKICTQMRTPDKEKVMAVLEGKATKKKERMERKEKKEKVRIRVSAASSSPQCPPKKRSSDKLKPELLINYYASRCGSDEYQLVCTAVYDHEELLLIIDNEDSPYQYQTTCFEGAAFYIDGLLDAAEDSNEKFESWFADLESNGEAINSTKLGVSNKKGSNRQLKIQSGLHQLKGRLLRGGERGHVQVEIKGK